MRDCPRTGKPCYRQCIGFQCRVREDERTHEEWVKSEARDKVLEEAAEALEKEGQTGDPDSTYRLCMEGAAQVVRKLKRSWKP